MSPLSKCKFALGKCEIYEVASQVAQAREREMELKLTGIALNRPKNHIGGKKYTREVKWVIFI